MAREGTESLLSGRNVLSERPAPPKRDFSYMQVRFDNQEKGEGSLMIGERELRLMIQQLLAEPISYDVAIQDVLLLLVNFYTGCCPGSIMPTKSYNNFLQWNQIKIRPQAVL